MTNTGASAAARVAPRMTSARAAHARRQRSVLGDIDDLPLRKVLRADRRTDFDDRRWNKRGPVVVIDRDRDGRTTVQIDADRTWRLPRRQYFGNDARGPPLG